MSMDISHVSWSGASVLVLILVLPSLGQDLPRAKPEEVGVSSEKVAELSKFMQSLVDEGKIPGGVAMMARHGKVIHFKAVGMADREENREMKPDAIFRIASMTKPITSVAIMMLWEQGKLGLDDPVSKYIPEFKNPQVLVSVKPWKIQPAEREITIRDLLTHTSGLGYPHSEKIGPIYEKNGIEWGLCTTELPLEENIRRLAELPLLFHPGTAYEYGMSSDVLGRVVEQVSGKGFDRFVETNICQPLGMKDTSFRVEEAKRPRLVAAYLPATTGIKKIRDDEKVRYDLKALGVVKVSSDYPYTDSHKYLSGGAGLCSTAEDYMRFCQMLLSRGKSNGVRLLREETVTEMTRNQLAQLENVQATGFGIFGIKSDDESVHQQLRSSYSPGGFWSTLSVVSPRGKWIVIAMTQLAWDTDSTPEWFAQYEKIAAEAIKDRPPVRATR